MSSRSGTSLPDSFTMMFLHGGWLHLILQYVDALVVRARRWRIGSGTDAILPSISPAALRPRLRISSSIRRRSFRRSAPPARLPACSDATCDSFRSRGSSCSFPSSSFRLFFEVHAFVFVGLWFVIQILQGTLELVLPSSQGGVAWWAHVGGFVAGFVLGPLLVQSERRYPKYYPDEGILGFDTAGRV